MLVLAGLLLQWHWFKPTSGAQAMQAFILKTDWTSLFILLCVLPAIGEEVLFRGIIGKGLTQRMGIVPGVVVTSLLFGLVHLEPAQIVTTTLVGTALHIVFIKTQSLWLPILLHMAHNTLAMLYARRALPDLRDITLHPMNEGALPLVLWGLSLVTTVFILAAFVRSKSPNRTPDDQESTPSPQPTGKRTQRVLLGGACLGLALIGANLYQAQLSPTERLVFQLTDDTYENQDHVRNRYFTAACWHLAQMPHDQRIAVIDAIASRPKILQKLDKEPTPWLQVAVGTDTRVRDHLITQYLAPQAPTPLPPHIQQAAIDQLEHPAPEYKGAAAITYPLEEIIARVQERQRNPHYPATTTETNTKPYPRWSDAGFVELVTDPYWQAHPARLINILRHPSCHGYGRRTRVLYALSKATDQSFDPNLWRTLDNLRADPKLREAIDQPLHGLAAPDPSASPTKVDESKYY